MDLFRGEFDLTAGTEEHGVVVEVKGGSGGHSGMDIQDWPTPTSCRPGSAGNGRRRRQRELAALDGGGLRNAIPREAKAMGRELQCARPDFASRN